LSCHADSVTFSTFHALFLAILKDRVPGIRVIPDLQRRRFLQRALEDFFPYASLRPDPETLTAWMTARIAGGEAAEEPAFEEILSQYRRYLEDEGLVDLDEAAGMCTRILRREPELLRRWQARWTYFLVDEFQDINAPQYRTLLLLAGEACNVFAVGDDDQSIYGFRGSSPLFMRRFPEEHPGCAKFCLTTNYRSSGEIVQASAAVIGRNRNRIPKQLRAAAETAGCVRKTPAVEVLGLPSETEQEQADRSWRHKLSNHLSSYKLHLYLVCP
jgi:DNA helicase-2/ATP-dependent DNA helicase PcrA